MRLIDADGLLEYIGLYGTKENRECNAGAIVTLEDFGAAIVTLEDFDAQPTIDATQVVHGHWIDRIEIFRESEGEVRAIGCSVCNKSQRIWSRTNYCPNCGAKMDEAE